MGRPTKLTPETHDAIVNAVRRGNYIETAAALAGVSKVTLYKWLRQGARAKSGAFRKFTLDVRQAQAAAEDDDITAIVEAGRDPRNWTARAWRLERRFPAKWGKREKLTQDVTVNWREQARKDGIADVDGLFEQLVQAAMDQRSGTRGDGGSEPSSSSTRED